MLNVWYDSLTSKPHTIHIKERTLYEAVQCLQRCINEAIVKPEEFKWANLDLNSDCEIIFPIVFSSKEGCSLCIANQEQSQQEEIITILEMMGFEPTDQEKEQIISVPLRHRFTMSFSK